MNLGWQRLVEFIAGRSRVYQHTFNVPHGKAVLVDLAKFCRANENAVVLNKDGSVNTEMTFMLNGRREVWLRIQQHLNIPANELAEIYSGQTKPKEPDQ